MSRRRKKSRKRQRNLIIVSVICLSFVLITGYAAFSTTLNITAKGNIVDNTLTTEKLKSKYCNTTDGDGLYVDTVTDGRCYYRGSEPDNYIIFNDEVWRIISIESDNTLKIIRNEQLDSTLAWDTAGTRDSSTSTYCSYASSSGCNAWAAAANLVGSPSEFIQYYPDGNPDTATETYSGTVTADASLNTYLNETYYNTLSSTAQSYVVTGTFNVSTPGDYGDTETLEVDAEQEKQYQWQGKVALMTVTELLRASTTTDCSSLNAGHYSNETGYCYSNNWLWPTFGISNVDWMLSPDADTAAAGVWNVQTDGSTSGSVGRSPWGFRAVLHLSSALSLGGTGKKDDPYMIVS